jgi:hypothetical protein
MKNEPGIRLFRHRLSRLGIMPSHHAVKYPAAKEAFSLLLNRAGRRRSKARRNLLVRDGGKERWIALCACPQHRRERMFVVGRNSSMKWQIVSKGGDEDCRVRTTQVQACWKQGREQYQWILEVNWECRQLERILEPKAGP